MNIKRTLIERLPPEAKRLLAVPYDRYQTWQADRVFARRDLPSYRPAPDAPAHIVCVVVDALRADHVDDDLTPYIASLNGCNAVAPATWTFPAMSSMLAGCYPHEHGAMRGDDEHRMVFELPPRMDERRETITEVLGGAGYDTYGGFGHDTPFVALSGRFQRHALDHNVTATAEDVFDRYLDWVAGRDRTFALLHLADPHVPVDPPDRYWEAHDVDRSVEGIERWDYQHTVDCDADCERYREHRRRLYRAAVAYVDDALESFVGRLEETVDDPLVTVTADHGEALWEHVDTDVEEFDGTGCVGHGGTPYEQLARVPIATTADWELSADASLIDLAPTFADVAGLEWSASGHSLVDGVPEDRTPLVEATLQGHERKAVYDRDAKLLVSQGDDVEIGYTVPGEERVDLPAERRETMLETLPPWPDGTEAGTEVSEVVEERLDKLGYR